MAQRGIREFDGKKLLARHLPKYSSTGVKLSNRRVLVRPETDLNTLKKEHRWLAKSMLVVKPDQLFGKRGKHKLILLDTDFEGAKKFVKEHMHKQVTIGKTRGTLTHFLIEEFIPHDEELYVAIRTERDSDIIYFSQKGGIYVEENWNKVKRVKVPVLGSIKNADVNGLLKGMSPEKITKVADFIKALYKVFLDLGFTYLEINPFTFKNHSIAALDLVARIDDTSTYRNQNKWGSLEFPAPFGRKLTKEEEFIKKLDAESGASLKLTILKPKGRVWTMVAGGGASVVYADTICDLGFSKELANYGEYSGNPTTEETYYYAKTILDLMTREKHPKGKVLIIGGGIANFTDVAKTFTGIIKAIEEHASKIKKNNIKIYVRRGGPNYQEGLKNMKQTGERLGLNIKVYGPETHMTRIIPMALGRRR